MTAAQHSAAAERVPVVHTVTLRHMPLGHARAQLLIVNYVYTDGYMYLQCYSGIEIVALERMYTLYPGYARHRACTTVLKYMKSHSYPKSTL